MTITMAHAVVQTMRGKSHSYLVEMQDGKHYVTKFRWSPATRRQLINEWIGAQLLTSIGIATPPVSVVEATADFLDKQGGKLDAISRKPDALRGMHFGSQFPGDPGMSIIYDYLPDSIVARVVNLDDFVGMLLFDLWCGKTSRRQAIFVREKKRHGVFRALMVEYRDLFGGEAWSLDGAGAPGLHISRAAYSRLQNQASLAPWLTKIRDIPTTFLSSLASSVPQEWLEGDRLALNAMLQRLIIRRDSLPALALGYIRSSREYFPFWDESPVAVKTHRDETGPDPH